MTTSTDRKKKKRKSLVCGATHTVMLKKLMKVN